MKAAIADGKTRMRTTQIFPELNTEVRWPAWRPPATAPAPPGRDATPSNPQPNPLQNPRRPAQMDVYRVGTLLEGVRELACQLAADGKRVAVCVQPSMGTGVFTAMPMMLNGIRRIMDAMDWGEGEGFIRTGSIGPDECAPDDDVFILIAPQHITGHSVLPLLLPMAEAAGARPMVLISPRLADIPRRGRGGGGGAAAPARAFGAAFCLLLRPRL